MPSYLVTGANRGLGYGFVQQIVNQDPSNVVIGLVRDKASADAKVAGAGLKNVHFVQGDISDYTSLVKARETVSSITGGKLDYLINNAAYLARNTEDDGIDEFLDDAGIAKINKELRDAFDVNVVGVVDTINVFLPLIRKGDVKKIVVISSGVSLGRPQPHLFFIVTEPKSPTSDAKRPSHRWPIRTSSTLAKSTPARPTPSPRRPSTSPWQSTTPALGPRRRAASSSSPSPPASCRPGPTARNPPPSPASAKWPPTGLGP